MPKDEKALSDLLERVPMSEPFKTFKSNIATIFSLLGMTSSVIDARENEVKQSLTETVKRKKYHEGKLQEDKDRLRRLYRMRHEIAGGKKTVKELEELIRQERELVGDRKGFIKELDSDIEENYPSSLDTFQKQKAVLMPMVFVYLVTIWDAFIMDTVRKILGVHPELITVSDEEIKVSASFLWNVKSSEDMRNYLIERKVRELDYDRKKLVETFVDYWGIDWKKSGIPLGDVVEIRARRDIWVHNKGVVNKQYLDMVGEDTSLEGGQTAEIDVQYFDACLDKLTRLSLYIHKIADKKHYAKTVVG